jgi:uncharacterized protein (DUF1800 family)
MKPSPETAPSSTECRTRAQTGRRGFLRWTGTAAAGLSVSCDSRMRKAMLGPIGDAIDAVKLESFSSPDGNEVDLLSHALSRLTWGVTPGLYEYWRKQAPTAEAAAEKFIAASVAVRDSKGLAVLARIQASRQEAIQEAVGELYDFNPRQLNFELTQAALVRAVHSPNQLYERMVAFWSDHFNIDSSKADCRWLKPYDDREVIRPHALGKFSDLLRASALSPAMLFYLDGRQNKRRKPEDKPNENYARELLELHTLGVHGGYTQQDVMEAARCLTGWTVKGKDNKLFSMGPGGLAGIGSVAFIKYNHDDGAKTVLGKTIAASGGPKDLDDLLDIVTQHASTAQFIATKLCRHFIADEPPAAAIAATAAAFTKSSGDIPETLRALFAAESFRTERRSKFKRPFHYLVSLYRALGVPTDGGMELQRALRRMGHMPFDYPTPEGYADVGEDWMSTLLGRWDFALRLGRGETAPATWKQQQFLTAAGSTGGMLQHLLGRKPSADESAALQATPEADQLALALSLPGFQLY